MRIVVAPDSMGGLLTARQVAAALVEGWVTVRPEDDLRAVPMSDGGEGLVDVVRTPDDRVVTLEVAGPQGHPLEAPFLVRGDTAIVESAAACGLAHVPQDRRDPLRATTYGVGELLGAARREGARRILVGLGGSATVDGGAGALTGLGYRLRVADGSGLKVGGADLHRIDRIERGWATPAWADVDVVLLTDVRTVLADAARAFGPQKGATPEVVERLSAALQRWAEVAARDLEAPDLASRPGTGAAGGLGYGLAAALGGPLVPGAPEVAALVGLDAHLDHADLVVTGEGRLDATSWAGKVVGEVADRAARRDLPVAVVVGQVDDDTDRTAFTAVETAPATDRDDALAAVVAAGARLARSITSPGQG